MQKRIFKTVWEDLEHSKGWFGKICLMALLMFIPIFGPLVLLSYGYGWAREIAWDVNDSLPRKLFANEDGKFWKRGWRIILLLFVFELIPSLLVIGGNAIPNTMVVMTIFGAQLYENPVYTTIKNILIGLGDITSIVFLVFAVVGSMRIAIYDKLSAGFQIRVIWRMLHHDLGGIFRIIGMVVIVGFICFVVLVIIALIAFYPLLYIAVMNLFNSTYYLDMMGYMTQLQQVAFVIDMLISIGPLGIAAGIVFLYLCNLFLVFVLMLSMRALGYWTKQFKVSLWGDQKDPLPFELHEK